MRIHNVLTGDKNYPVKTSNTPSGMNMLCMSRLRHPAKVAFMAPCNALMRRSVGPGPINEPMRAAQALCNGKWRGEAERVNLPPCWKQSALAEEMRHAGDIEPESIGIQMRAAAARGPAGEIK